MQVMTVVLVIMDRKSASEKEKKRLPQKKGKTVPQSVLTNPLLYRLSNSVVMVIIYSAMI